MPNQRPRNSLIVPIFIPNQGCPFRCIYCRQETITSDASLSLEPDQIRIRLDQAVQAFQRNSFAKAEIAFYGGTFTNLSKEKIKTLLDITQPYMVQGFFKSIRVSTRPDTLDDEKLDMMSHYGVTVIELGVQSLQDSVLAMTGRSYKAVQVVDAVGRLKKKGFTVGIQLMLGLPGDSEKGFLETIQATIQLRPAMVRLYPTLVIQGTTLAEWYLQKRYQPLELHEAVQWCVKGVEQLEGNHIPVIRIGLMASPLLMQKGQILAGPWHACFGFLVRSALYHQLIEPRLPQPGLYSAFALRVAQNEVSLARGYRNQGLLRIEEKTGSKVTAVIGDKSLAKGSLEIVEA